MKTFKFKFEKILNIKQQELDDLIKQLSVMRNQKIQLQSALLKQKDYYLNFEQNLNNMMKKGISGQEFQGYVYQKNSITKAIKHLEDNLVQLESQIEVKLQIVLDKKSEVKGFEKLKEKQKVEFDDEMRKQQTQMIDEIVTLKANTTT